MKKYLFIIAAAATCLLVACSKEKELRAPEEETVATVEHLPGWTYIGATSIEESKASLTDDATPAFQWNTGDKIAVYSGDTYYVSAGLTSGGSSSAEFAFEGEIAAGRKYFAVYPSSLVHDGTSVISGCDSPSDNSLTVNLPSTYSISEVQGLASPVPMVAVNTADQALAFKSVCALVRFSLTNVPKQTKAITFGFNGKKVHGLFNITGIDRNDPDAMLGVQAAAAASASDTVITVNGISLSALQQDYVVNIPVPAGVASSLEYQNVTITTLDEGGHKINSFRAQIKSSGNWVPTRKGRRKLAVTLPVFTTQGNIGFNNGKKVVFAPGNLQATVGTKASNSTSAGGQAVLAKVKAGSYKFAAHQYDFIGATNGNRLTSANLDVDLFNWTGSSADPVTDNTEPGYLGMTEDQYGMLFPSLNSAGKPFFYAANDPDHPGPKTTSALSNWYYYTGDWDGSGEIELLKKDWGEWAISDEVGTYQANTWRTPGKDPTGSSEWLRVALQRKDPALSNAVIDYLVAKATINNGSTLVAHGVIVFPDSYDPTGKPAITNHTSSTVSASHYSDNVLSLEQWEQLEAVGCVFLPANNLRQSSSGVKIYNDGDCTYWSNYAISGSSPKASCFFANDLNLVNQPSYDTIKADLKIHTYNTGGTYLGDKGMGRQYGCGVRLIRDIN